MICRYGVYNRCIELIEAGVNVNEQDAENVSLLHWAAINNRMNIVKLACDYKLIKLLYMYLHS